MIEGADPRTWTWLGALLLGGFGSAHCVAMCGGIAAALGQRSVERQRANWPIALAHSAGRIAGYAIVGAIVGFAGESVALATGRAEGLRVVVGLVIIASGLHVSGVWRGLARIEQLGHGVWRRLLPLARRLGPGDGLRGAFALGVLWGWLPCGLVYFALAGAAASGGALAGAAFMTCFGVGTLPAVAGVSLLGAHAGRWLALHEFRGMAGALLVLLGVWSVAIGSAPPMGHSHAPAPPTASTPQAHRPLATAGHEHRPHSPAAASAHPARPDAD